MSLALILPLFVSRVVFIVNVLCYRANCRLPKGYDTVEPLFLYLIANVYTMMRKPCVLFALFYFFACPTYAQVISPVKWKYEVKKAGHGIYDIYLIATTEAPWHIYSQFLKPGGPIPTQIAFGKNPLVAIVGKSKEVGKAIKEHEEVFNMDVTYFPGKVNFIQRVKIKAGLKTNIGGTITYMVCKEGECLPVGKQAFNVKLD